MPNSTPPEPNSTPLDPKVIQLRDILKEEGVHLDGLVICMLGGAECIIGEYEDAIGEDAADLAGRTIQIKNPKRVMRRQEQRGDTASIIFYLTDLDLISGGVIEVAPVAATALRWLDDESKIAYAGLYLIYLKNKQEERMARSGLIKPEPTKIPPQLLRKDLR